MRFGRRSVLAWAAAIVAGWRAPTLLANLANPENLANGAQGTSPMYGLIGKMLATPGNRDTLVTLLLEGTAAMPGCLSYVIATDPKDANAIWITEAWDSPESHAASLKLPAVQQTITRARPLIAGFGERFETVPVGGHGLTRPSP
jgi:quinol monooxygenase YgiN